MKRKFKDVSIGLPKLSDNPIQVIIEAGHKNHVPDIFCAIFFEGNFYDIEQWNNGENKVKVDRVLSWKYVN